MEFKRKSKKLTGLPIAFSAIVIFFFALVFSFYSVFLKSVIPDQPIVVEVPEIIEEDIDSLSKPEIYVPDVEVLPLDTVKLAKVEESKVEEKTEKTKVEEKKIADKKESKEDKKALVKEEKVKEDSKDDKITKIGKDRLLTAFIPGTMGKAGKLPSHNCKAKGELVMYITVDKAGNVTNAGRNKGISDPCNITAAVIWLKQYVKAKKSQNISQGTYTIVF